MNKEVISTTNAPAAIGPYAQGIKLGNLVFTSGQLPINPENGELVSDDIGKATKRSLENIKSILEQSGTTMEKIIKVTIFLKDLNDFAAVNLAYANFFEIHKPARSCVEVARLPKDALIEIEAIAYVD